MAKRVRLKAGDVLEIQISSGRGYVQYIGRHSEYGDAIRVVPRLAEFDEAISETLFADAYVTFYPAHASVAQGLSRVVGHLTSPGVPTVLRRAGARSGPVVATWVIEDGAGQIVVAHLGEKERRLPIAAIWNHEMLLHRIMEGWRPEWEGGSGGNGRSQRAPQ